MVVHLRIYKLNKRNILDIPIKYGFGRKCLAYLVHAFTASGLIAGFLAILAINQKDWRMAMIYLVLALFIDGIDGTFARAVKVKQVLPKIDGKTIDYIVDFVNYSVVPTYFLYMAEMFPVSWAIPCTALILLVSAIYYGKEGMVSEDFCFIGFPVLWNLAAFYMYFVFDFSLMGNVLLVLFLAVLHFVPIKFPYPSQATRWQIPTKIITTLGMLVLSAILYFYPEKNNILTILAILVLLYFGILSLLETFRNAG